MKGVPERKYEYIVAWFCWTGTWFVSMTQKVSHCKWMRILIWNEMNVDQHAWEWKYEWIWKCYDMNMHLNVTKWKYQEMRNEMRNVLWNDNMIRDCEMHEKKKEMKCMKRNVIWNMSCEMNENEECDCVMTTWDVIWLCNVWKEKRNKMYGNTGDMECMIVKQKEM